MDDTIACIDLLLEFGADINAQTKVSLLRRNAELAIFFLATSTKGSLWMKLNVIRRENTRRCILLQKGTKKRSWSTSS